MRLCKCAFLCVWIPEANKEKPVGMHTELSRTRSARKNGLLIIMGDSTQERDPEEEQTTVSWEHMDLGKGRIEQSDCLISAVHIHHKIQVSQAIKMLDVGIPWQTHI